MPSCLACTHTDTQPWAKASDEEYASTSDVFTYHRCNSCGVLFIDPVPRDRLSVIYPRNYYSFDKKVIGSPAYKIKDWLDQRFFKKFIAQLPHSEIRVLDVGGGNGLQLSSLKKVDPRIKHTAIVDIDEKAGEAARQLGHDYFCGRFEKYAPPHTFDVILMLNLIEHVDNPREFLEKALQLLSPGGIVIIKTPNIDSPDARLFRNSNWGGYHCPRHWVLFNREAFKELVQKAGLQIRYFKYTQGAPFWATSVLFALSRHKWISVSKDRPAPKHPLYSPLLILFACMDLVLSQFIKTSQMIVVLQRGKIS